VLGTHDGGLNLNAKNSAPNPDKVLIRRLQHEINQLVVKHKENEEKLINDNSNLKEALRLCMADIEKEKAMTDTLQKCVQALKIKSEKLPKENEGAEKSNKKKCRFFVKANGCNKGDECQFMHNSNESQEKNDVELVEKKQTLCRYYGKPNGCNKGNNCIFIHEERNNRRKDEESEPPAKECTFFNRVNGCRNGTQCKFTHIVKPPCTSTQCSGKNCGLSHKHLNNQNNGHREENELPARECTFFNRVNGCRNGTQCKFTHVEKPPCTSTQCSGKNCGLSHKYRNNQNNGHVNFHWTPHLTRPPGHQSPNNHQNYNQRKSNNRPEKQFPQSSNNQQSELQLKRDLFTNQTI
jgi:hypothetical protein